MTGYTFRAHDRYIAYRTPRGKFYTGRVGQETTRRKLRTAMAAQAYAGLVAARLGRLRAAAIALAQEAA